MYTNPALKASLAYKSVGAYSGVESADPHRLIEMLLNGALEKIAVSKGHIERREIAAKGAAIGKAIAILDELRVSLDKKEGGELAQNLDDLYDYMQRQLALSNVQNNVNVLDEVSSLLTQIKNGWAAIPQEVRREPTRAAAA